MIQSSCINLKYFAPRSLQLKRTLRTLMFLSLRLQPSQVSAKETKQHGVSSLSLLWLYQQTVTTAPMSVALLLESAIHQMSLSSLPLFSSHINTQQPHPCPQLENAPVWLYRLLRRSLLFGNFTSQTCRAICQSPQVTEAAFSVWRPK